MEFILEDCLSRPSDYLGISKANSFGKGERIVAATGIRNKGWNRRKIRSSQQAGKKKKSLRLVKRKITQNIFKRKRGKKGAKATYCSEKQTGTSHTIMSEGRPAKIFWSSSKRLSSSRFLPSRRQINCNALTVQVTMFLWEKIKPSEDFHHNKQQSGAALTLINARGCRKPVSRLVMRVLCTLQKRKKSLQN